MLRSEGLDPDALTFAFWTLYLLDEPARAALALTKAQATQVYAGLGLWPAGVMAKLAEAQLVADGTYPNAAAVFAEVGAAPVGDAGYNPAQLRNSGGQWTAGGGNSTTGSASIILAANSETEREVSQKPDGTLSPSSRPDLVEAARASASEKSNPLAASANIIRVASTNPALKRIHPDTTYESDPAAKRSLDYWRKQSTDDIVKDLRDNPREPLTVKPDGRVMNGNTRLKVLQDRGYPIDALPRTIHPDPFDDDLILGGGGGRIHRISPYGNEELTQ